MEFIQVSNDSEVRIIALARGKANAMNLAMIEELLQAVVEAEADAGVRALLFCSARTGVFSGGFDVEDVFAYDIETFRHFFGRFMEFFDRTLKFPKPTVGAIGGFAYAGGAFLATSFDTRILAEGDYGIALNEINFGAVLPRILRLALQNIVGSREATRMILTGASVNPQQAFASGLADAVVPPEKLMAVSLELAHKAAQKPSNAFLLSKRALLGDAGFADLDTNESLEAFLDQWFSSECVERRKALVASLKAKSSVA